MPISDGPDQEYLIVTKMTGNMRLEAKTFNGEKRLGTIRGSMRKRQWINVDDVVLATRRDFETGEAVKVDIIHRYTPEEVRRLERMGEIVRAKETAEEPDDAVVFEDI